MEPQSVVWLAVQGIKAYSDFIIASQDMDEEERTSYFFTVVQPAVAQAERRWDSAGGEG